MNVQNIPAAPLLEIRELSVRFPGSGRDLLAVNGVGLSIRPREIVGIVGESGSGKSVTALSILRLVQGARISGEIALEGRSLAGLTEREMRKLRGGEIGMVFQNPMTSLNPSYPVGSQLIEAIRLHRRTSRAEARGCVLARLAEVGLPDPERVFNAYPHELSGGMKQRAMIAMAMCCEPRLLIADEPTTALDVTTQAQILHLLDRMRHDHGTAVLLITHDLGVVAEICDRVVVMYAGAVVEEGPVDDILDAPRHPYTHALIEAIPSAETRRRRLYSIPGAALMRAEAHACGFAPRCPRASALCHEAVPALGDGGQGRAVRCWHPLDAEGAR